MIWNYRNNVALAAEHRRKALALYFEGHKDEARAYAWSACMLIRAARANRIRGAR